MQIFVYLKEVAMKPWRGIHVVFVGLEGSDYFFEMRKPRLEMVILQ